MSPKSQEVCHSSSHSVLNHPPEMRSAALRKMKSREMVPRCLMINLQRMPMGSLSCERIHSFQTFSSSAKMARLSNSKAIRFVKMACPRSIHQSG